MSNQSYLNSSIHLFEYYRTLGETAIDQVKENNLFREVTEESNSIAIIVKHLSGNMLSRWTNFLTEDGEKEWRMRDDEFTDADPNKEKLMQRWNKGWDRLLNTLTQLTEEDLTKHITIRGEQHTVIEAINRQLGHYAYHVGQIVFIARMLSENWKSLSIPKNKSADFNKGIGSFLKK